MGVEMKVLCRPSRMRDRTRGGLAQSVSCAWPVAPWLPFRGLRAGVLFYSCTFGTTTTTTTTKTYFRLASHLCSIVRARGGIASSQPSGLSSRGRGITSERALLGAPLSSSSESSVANLDASGVSSGCAQPAPIRRFGGERGSRRFDPTSSERERFLAEPEMVLAAPCRARLWL